MGKGRLYLEVPATTVIFAPKDNVILEATSPVAT
jgi:hypothetical protein